MSIDIDQIDGLRAILDDLNSQISGIVATMPAGLIFGLGTANDATNPTTHITIAPGQCKSWDLTTDIVLAAGMTKRLDAVWAAGTGNGGRDSATALALNQSWHVHLIKNPNTNVVDVLFSQSVNNPTLPAGFTKFRRIFSLPRLGTATTPGSGTDIPSYLQTGNITRLIKPYGDYTAQTGVTTPQLKAIMVPLGIKVEAELCAQLSGNGTLCYLRITDPDLTTAAASRLAGGVWGQIRIAGNETYLTWLGYENCNNVGQVYVTCTDNTGTWALTTRGWRDTFREQL